MKRLHFRMQNAECRVRKKMKWDSVNSNSDFDFRAGLWAGYRLYVAGRL